MAIGTGPGLRKPICATCETAVEPGTLVAHMLAVHPKPKEEAPKKTVCYKPKCCEFYGPAGHMVGAEGPHAY
jgi:hypothetical protein